MFVFIHVPMCHKVGRECSPLAEIMSTAFKKLFKLNLDAIALTFSDKLL